MELFMDTVLSQLVQSVDLRDSVTRDGVGLRGLRPDLVICAYALAPSNTL